MMHTGIKAKEIYTEILEKMDHSINADPLYPAYLGDTGYWVENGKYVAFDNTSGDCWMEEFKTKAQAENWINGEEAADINTMDEQETNILSRLNYIKNVLDEVEIRVRLDKNQDGTLVLLNPEFINDVPGIQDLYELAGSFNSPLLGYIGTQSSLIDAFFMSSDLKASTAILNLVMFGNYSQIQPEIAKGISAWLELQRRVKSEIADAGDHTTAPQEPKQNGVVL